MRRGRRRARRTRSRGARRNRGPGPRCGAVLRERAKPRTRGSSTRPAGRGRRTSALTKSCREGESSGNGAPDSHRVDGGRNRLPDSRDGQQKTVGTHTLEREVVDPRRRKAAARIEGEAGLIRPLREKPFARQREPAEQQAVPLHGEKVFVPLLQEAARIVLLAHDGPVAVRRASQNEGPGGHTPRLPLNEQVGPPVHVRAVAQEVVRKFGEGRNEALVLEAEGASPFAEDHNVTSEGAPGAGLRRSDRPKESAFPAAGRDRRRSRSGNR